MPVQTQTEARTIVTYSGYTYAGGPKVTVYSGVVSGVSFGPYWEVENYDCSDIQRPAIVRLKEILQTAKDL